MTGNLPDCEVSELIPDEERIVRAVKSPYHYDTKKAKLRPAAFVPAAGNSDVSVVRTALGHEIAAEQARQVARTPEYCGLAVVNASKIRSAGSTVYDHKKDFCGHAHVNHGIQVPPKGETFDPAIKMMLDDRCKAIVAECTYHPDSHDTIVGWSGDPF